MSEFDRILLILLLIISNHFIYFLQEANCDLKWRWKDNSAIIVFLFRDHLNHILLNIFERLWWHNTFLYFNEKYVVDFEKITFQWQKCLRYISRKSISSSELLFNRPRGGYLTFYHEATISSAEFIDTWSARKKCSAGRQISCTPIPK